ncbi:MAG: LVIVD repeat-containing protein [Saprospiraceae bacterium]
MTISPIRYACLFLVALTFLVGCEGESFDSPIGSPSSNSTGTNSSYARILTVGNFLYAVNVNELVTFDATDPSDPTELNRQEVGDGVETIFHLDGILLIGSNLGTFTYTIGSNGIPTRRGQFDYNTLDIPVEPCDPVVAQGDVAFATLYTSFPGEGPCGRDQLVNLLVVMDISDLENPTLITTEQTTSPRGLAVKGDYLYVCNEYAGLTVFDVSTPSEPTIVSQVTDILAYDVIVKDDVLIVVGGSELIQYDYANPEELIRLSTISLK